MDVPAAWLAAGLVAFAGILATLVATVRRMGRELRRLRHAQQSLATRHGQAIEQFVPLLADWPWDPSGFRFLGDPIDGIQFTPEGIILVEVKTGRSRLKPSQQAVRDHVAAGRVRFQEVRIG